MEIIEKFVRNIHNDCDNHITIAHLFKKIEVLLTRDFDSLTDEKFDELRFEVLINQMAIDEYKCDTEK